jgi:acyl-CoA synthetase (NDP forming)/GNAT superfamily N-acetyltransferase
LTTVKPMIAQNSDRLMDTYALLADGTTVEIRPAAPGDFDAVQAMHAAMSPDNIYLRFFGYSRLSADREAERICREARPGRVALLALAADEVVGVASYDIADCAGEPADSAEVAFAVAEHMHHRGIATLLLEHLVSAARSRGVTTFTAQALAENTPMLHVFADAGLPVERHCEDGVVEVTIPLPTGDTGTTLDTFLETVARRERDADAASLRHVLAPESVVVIGASQRTGTAGRAILDNIRTCGYAGRLYAIHPQAHQLGGVHCVPALTDLPESPDLAVIAVPAPAVLDIAEGCGRLGVRALAVITSGLDAPACADLLAGCRRHGMRLVGPDSFGIAVPGIGLDATFAVSHPRPGVAGLVMQSGGLGLAMVDQLSGLGIGISSFASVGSKLDVSSNDMLLWWEQDGVTKLAVLYIESFGNPRKFARTARRVGARMPVLTVHAGQFAADEHAAAPHTAAAPLGGREALFEQAGIIATPGLGELVETAALLATQPIPAGRTVAIVSNVGGAGVLAADACADLGLTVHRPHGVTRRKLRTLIPGTGVVTGPVDTTVAISGEGFRQCLELVAADEEVHAVIALVLPTGATGDLTQAIRQADISVPLAAVVLNQAESVRVLDGTVPAYAYPEAAAGALARAARYGAWRAEPRGQVPAFPDVRAADARAVVREYLQADAGDGWLPPGQTADVLCCYGISLAERNPATDDHPTEVTVRVVQDEVFGPLVVLADHWARLTPLTSADADALLLGYRGRHAARLAAASDPMLRDLLLRVSRLAEDLPEITDLDLGPIVARPAGVHTVNARIKVARHEPHDPFLRKLR